MYLLDKWIDLGPGCCSKDANDEHKSFMGLLTNGNLQTCKNKCLEDKDCTRISYGWADSTYCTCYKSNTICTPLKNGPTDCGSSGNNGVHTYEFKARELALSLYTNLTQMQLVCYLFSII